MYKLCYSYVAITEYYHPYHSLKLRNIIRRCIFTHIYINFCIVLNQPKEIFFKCIDSIYSIHFFPHETSPDKIPITNIKYMQKLFTKTPLKIIYAEHYDRV